MNKKEIEFRAAWDSMRNRYISNDMHIFDQTFIPFLEDEIWNIFHKFGFPCGLIKKCYKINMEQYGYAILQSDEVLTLMQMKRFRLV